MTKVNIQQARTQLSRLLERVASGEEIVIARAGTPVAKLVPFHEEHEPRRLGLYAGQIQLAPDFDDLPEELRAAFEGEAL